MKQEYIKELVDGILEALPGRVLQIVLYGSVARGTQTSESDVDIAVFLSGRISSEEQEKLSDIVVDLNIKYDKVFSVIDIDDTVYRKWKKVVPFYQNVDQEGVVLWKATAWMAGRSKESEGSGMKIYLDNCSYNRPFDDQTNLRINLETQAKLQIQEDIKCKKYELVWSYVLDYEVEKNPFIDRREAIFEWRRIAPNMIREESEEILFIAEELEKNGVKPFDALHIACAKSAGCEYFITTDKKLFRVVFPEMRVVNPIEFVMEMEERG